MNTEDITEDLIEKLVYANATKFETKPEHWIHGSDESESYCRDCAEKEIERLSAESPEEEFILDGGWGEENDSQPFCATCGAALRSSFTTYACESELDHFEDQGFDLDSPSDCYSMERIMGSVGFLDDELTPRIRNVIRLAIEARDASCEKAS